MDHKEFKDFLKEEIEEIKKYRQEQMKKGMNSNDSVKEWIKFNAKAWRKNWEKKYKK